MPYPAKLIAAAFVKKGIDEGIPVTQMKLQKMVYFAHGYHLAKFDTPLVEELFEAWKFGPVIQSIYGQYRSFGNSPITELPGKHLLKELLNISVDARSSIEFTWIVTKHMSAIRLSNWTHRVGSPWATVYSPELWSASIGNDIIKNYFSDLIKSHGNVGSHQTAR